MTFSNQARLAIEAFAENLGLGAVPAADGSCSFAFEHAGILTFTPAPERGQTLMSLLAPALPGGQASNERLMAMAGPDASTGLFLSVGLTGEQVIFSVALRDCGIDLPAIETGLQQLFAARRALQ